MNEFLFCCNTIIISGIFHKCRSFLFNLKRLHGKEPITHQHKNKYVIVKSSSALPTFVIVKSSSPSIPIACFQSFSFHL